MTAREHVLGADARGMATDAPAEASVFSAASVRCGDAAPLRGEAAEQDP